MAKVIIEGTPQTVEVVQASGGSVDITNVTQKVEVGSPVSQTVEIAPRSQTVEVSGTSKNTVQVNGTNQRILVVSGFGANITDHRLLSFIGVNTHIDIDSHIASDIIHFSDTGVDGINYLRSDNSWVPLPPYFSEVHNDLTGRDVPDVHPASSISIPPIDGIDNVADLLVLMDDQIGLRETAATGVISGGLVSLNPGSPTTMVDVAAGAGEIVDGYSDRRNPTRTNINWLAATVDLLPHFLQDTGIINIHIEVNIADPDDSTIVVGQGPLGESVRRTQIQLAAIFYRGGVIDDVVHAPILSNEVGNTLYDLITFIPPADRTIGLDVLPIAGAMSVYMLAGKLFAPGANVDFGNPTTINILDLEMIGNNVTPALFDIIFEDGTVQAANQTVLPEYYESAPGVTSNLIANQAAIHYLYRTIGGKLLLQLGQVEYQNGKVARDSIPADRTTYGKFIGNESTLFSAQIYMQRNTSDFDDGTLAGIVDNLGSGGSSLGPGGSVSEFLALTDVNPVTYAGQARRMVSVNDVTLGNGDALEFTDEPVRWRGLWLSATYLTNDMVKDGDWTMIANKDTTERAAPQPIGDPLFTLPDPAPWEGDAFGSDVSVVECIHDYTMTQKGWIQVLKVWSPAGSANPDYTSRIYTYDITDPATPVLLSQTNNPSLAENAWTTVNTGSKIVQIGQVLRVVFQQFISSEGVSITGGWALGTFNSGGAPVAGNWNSNNNVTGNATLVRIDKTDLDGTDRSTELSGIVQDSTIRFVQTNDTTKSVDFIVATPTSIIDQGTYFDITVNTGATEGAGGRPDNGAVTTMDTFVPVAVPTEYVTKNNHWLSNNPPFANVKAELRYDGVPILGIGFPETAYGIDIEFQEASVSDDWDLVALSGGSSSSGGGTGGSEFFIDLLDTPADFVGAGDQLVAVKIDETGLEYIPKPVPITDHGMLDGLADDDHPQYHNDARGDLRYSLLAHTHNGVYEPVDPTILRDADIGVKVEAYLDNPLTDGYMLVSTIAGVRSWILPAAPQTFLHADLTDIGTDDHHAKSHAHDGLDGSGLVDYSDLTNLPIIPDNGDYVDLISSQSISGIKTFVTGARGEYFRVIAKPVSTPSSGWYRVAHGTVSNGRGGFSVHITTNGGGDTPAHINIRGQGRWDGQGDITVVERSLSMNITEVRLVADSDNSNIKYLECLFSVQLTSATAYFDQWGADNWAIYEGELPVGLVDAANIIVDELKIETGVSASKFYTDKAPVLGGHLANKDYVDANAGGGGGVHVGATPPVDKIATPIWFNTNTGKTLTWYSDVDSSQWVQDVAVSESLSNIATEQYVDDSIAAAVADIQNNMLLTLGGSLKSSAAIDADWNNHNTAGFFTGLASGSNAPPVGNTSWGVALIVVQGNNINNVSQLVLVRNVNAIWYRGKAGGAWTAWAQVL